MGAMDEIRHLVFLMLENQSFDRLLGYLDLGDPAQKLEGLTGTETNPVSPPADMTPIPVRRISSPRAYVRRPRPAGHERTHEHGLRRELFPTGRIRRASPR